MIPAIAVRVAGALWENKGLIVGALGMVAAGVLILSLKIQNSRLSSKVEHRTSQIQSVRDANARERLSRQVEMEANNRRVTAEQESINEQVETKHLASVAGWADRFDRLRRERRRNGGATGIALPASGQTPGKSYDPDHHPGGPADPSMIAIRIDDLETLVTGAQRGIDLQSWAAQQAGVITSPE